MAAQVAVVGSGLAGFTAYQTLRRAFQPAELVVFGTDADPAAAWRVRAAAIRQRAMRSESDGHCLPTTFPGLALRSVRRRRSLRPLLESLADRYHPTVEEFLAHVAELRERSRWDESLVLHRVERVRAVEGGFEVDGERFRHVLLAPGHPGLNVPEELRHDPRAVHAYEPHGYAPAVTVVGAGLAAATEWLNALAAGAEVVSVRRREPLRRPLNVPREYFSRRALADFHRLPAPQRVERLRALSAPSYPPGRAWDEPLARAAAEGRFRIQAAVNGTGQIICATGFLRGWRHDPAARPARRRARAPHRGGLDRARRRLGRARAQRPDADAGPRRRSRPVGLPRGRHARRRPLRRPPLPAPDPRMSYTLRGRVESRLAALLPLLLGCCAATGVLHEWWPVELCALMAAVGLALDVELWHRLLPYQPAWAAVPLGLAELGGLMAIVAGAGLHVPLRPALVLFGAGWLVSFALAQAGFPLLRLGYAEEGGELGRAGVAAAAAVALTLAGAAATVVVRLPPVVHLRAGVHRGPLVIRRREILQGAPGAVVRGGIVVAHDDVQIRDVTVVGGTNGITVDGVRGTVLDGVTVEGA
ncbi:MAG TPA: hypothetical protein VE995_06575, partial [Gaiellaceae bacterium]|nr:hypothetical protein [Gaiellaceae bacterium]